MIKTISIIVLTTSIITLISCNAKTNESKNDTNVPIETILPLESTKIEDYPFTINIVVEKLEKNRYNLVIVMDVDSGSHYASCFSNNNFTGLFKITIPNNSNIKVGDSLSEIPRSIASNDPFSNQTLNKVEVKTTYTQELKVLNSADFEFSGLISFVIEPICVRYEVEFTIIQKNEQMDIGHLSIAPISASTEY